MNRVIQERDNNKAKEEKEIEEGAIHQLLKGLTTVQEELNRRVIEVETRTLRTNKLLACGVITCIVLLVLFLVVLLAK